MGRQGNHLYRQAARIWLPTVNRALWNVSARVHVIGVALDEDGAVRRAYPVMSLTPLQVPRDAAWR
jgi:hypothetical protein